MRQEYLKQKHVPLISGRLANAIETRLAGKEQTILFLNRRGFATSLVCNQCGFVCDCPNCSVALTFHQGENRLKCHLCGHATLAPRKCPKCSDPSIRYAGYGTEKIEGTVRKLFPSATVARMDADSMARKDAYRQTLQAFRTGKIDVLVGTQMIAKGLDFPNVTLVGIINADVGLHMPDFRAGERTFQLLTQVAGRAGRGDMAGEVFVQSSTPFSPSIQFARHHNFEGFWEQEIEFRERCDYPPFLHLLMIHVRSEHQRLAEFTAETIHRRISEKPDPGVTLHPVVPAPIERSKGFYRYQILLRAKAIRRLSGTVRSIIDKLTFPEGVHVSVDVDPYQFLQEFGVNHGQRLFIRLGCKHSYCSTASLRLFADSCNLPATPELLLLMDDRSNGCRPVASQLFVLKKCKFHPAAAEKMPGLECMRKTKAAP